MGNVFEPFAHFGNGNAINDKQHGNHHRHIHIVRVLDKCLSSIKEIHNTQCKAKHIQKERLNCILIECVS